MILFYVFILRQAQDDTKKAPPQRCYTSINNFVKSKYFKADEVANTAAYWRYVRISQSDV